MGFKRITICALVLVFPLGVAFSANKPSPKALPIQSKTLTVGKPGVIVLNKVDYFGKPYALLTIEKGLATPALQLSVLDRAQKDKAVQGFILTNLSKDAVLKRIAKVLKAKVFKVVKLDYTDDAKLAPLLLDLKTLQATQTKLIDLRVYFNLQAYPYDKRDTILSYAMATLGKTQDNREPLKAAAHK
jgi:hypothetical protein